MPEWTMRARMKLETQLRRTVQRRWSWTPVASALALALLGSTAVATADAQVPAPVPVARPAQPAVPSRPQPGPGKPADSKATERKPALTPQQHAQQVRNKLRENIRAMRAQKLAEVLKPDAPTAAKLQDISETYGDPVMQLHEQARTARRDLVKQLQNQTPDQAAVGRLTEQLQSLRSKANRLDEERMTAVRKVLTPIQFGRYMLAWPKINRQIQEKIYQALEKMGERRDGGELF